MAANPVSLAHSTVPTKARLLAFIRRLCDEEEYESEEGRWIFRSGGDSGRCTDGAMKVAIEFDGLVVGYRTADNPSAVVPKYVDGHDFALIAGRFVVDYWGCHVANEVDRTVFDLNDPEEAKLVRHYFGKQTAWQTISISDEDTLRLRIGCK